jgi:hypothetical protein
MGADQTEVIGNQGGRVEAFQFLPLFVERNEPLHGCAPR